MINSKTRAAYIPTIGIECHVQLNTKTKLFTAVANDARESPPNTLVSHICFGMPGALPVLNKEAVRLAVRAAFALGTTPQLFSKFDRKHYFYPDLPKGYQISQYDEPIISGGEIEVPIIDEHSGQRSYLRVGIVRAHLEEDAGKSIHPAGKDYSLIDLNRAGTPLLEIVSQPDIHSAAEGKGYARELYLRMKYAGVSDCDLYLGHMRFDVNVSVSKDTSKLGIRTETKNLNSFRSIEKAIEYEIDRQIELLEKGQAVIQETRGWDEAKQRTVTQRTKEEAHDYRYMPDPDIPPIVLDQSFVDEVKESMPPLPDKCRSELDKLSIGSKVVEDVLSDVTLARMVLEVLNRSSYQDAKRVVFWLLQPTDADVENANLLGKTDVEQLIALSRLAEEGALSSTAAKTVYEELVAKGGKAEEIAKARNLIQLSDEQEIAGLVAQVLGENSKAAQDVKNGELKAIGFLVGQVMKASHGKANPTLVQKLIKTQLEQ